MGKTRFIALLSAAALVGAAFWACSSTEYVYLDEKEPVTVLNAQLNTMDKTHCILLSESASHSIKALQGARITVTVNEGDPVIAREETPEEYSSYTQFCGVYVFDAEFRPGDSVRIEAEAAGMKVRSEVSVPGPIEIVSIDTASVLRTEYDDLAEASLLVKARVKDPDGGRNYYRVRRLIEEYYPDGYYHYSFNPETFKMDRLFEEGPLTESGYSTFDCSEEPLISGIAAAGSSSDGETVDIGALFEADNTWSVFDDTSFDGTTGEYVLRLYIPYWNQYQSLTACTRSEYLVINSLSFDEYHFLKALDASDFATFISEPVSMPSNVEGGLGMVSVESVSVARIFSLEVEVVDEEDYYDFPSWWDID